MLRRVLVATDGEEHARRAEEMAVRLAAPGQALEIELLYVEPRLAPKDVHGDGTRPWQMDRRRIPPEEAEAAQALLRAAEERVRSLATGTEISIWSRFVVSNDVAGMIVHEGERSSADLIIIGGRYHAWLARLLGGSISDEVLRRAPRPVMLVP